jgi:DNA adenine methylase
MYTKNQITGNYILKPPLKIIGGKTKIRGFLYSLFPSHDRYLEPFGGSFGVLIGKDKSKDEMINDIQPHVVNFYSQIKKNPDILWERLNRELVYYQKMEDPKIRFLYYRDELAVGSDLYYLPEKYKIEQAVLYYLVNKTCLNGIIRFNSKGNCNSSYGGTVKGRGFLTKEWYMALQERLKKVVITNKDYVDFLHGLSIKARNEFIFLDPPYYEVFTSYNSKKFSKEDHRQLADTLKTLKSRWMLTINYHEDILTLYNGCNILDNYVNWSCSQTSAGRGLKKELIITNY